VKVETYPDRASWLAARRTGIGGSDVAAILGESPWRDALGVWTEKVGIAPEETDEPEWIRVGHKVERVILELLQEEIGTPLVPCDLEIDRHPSHPCLAYSPDGFTGDRRALVEFKNVSAYKSREWDDGAPRHYWMQVQHGLDVTGRDHAYIAALIGGNTFRWQRIARDDEWIEATRPKLLEFWRHVVEETPPAPSAASSKEALDAAHPTEDGRTVLLGGDALELTWEIERIDALSGELKASRDNKRNQVRAMLGTAEVGVLPGGFGTWTYKADKRGQRSLRQSKGDQSDG